MTVMDDLDVPLALERRFVGRGWDSYYRHVFERHAGGAEWLGWNWWAFALGPWWCFYRMIHPVGLPFLFYLIFREWLPETPGQVVGILWLSGHVLLGAYGNRLYVWWVGRSLRELQQHSHDEAHLLEQISRFGGTFRDHLTQEVSLNDDVRDFLAHRERKRQAAQQQRDSDEK